ncbi:protein-tyrosine phosphatase-like protein [Powellomyces hirtus]|nr:protein-tyrosine phosphatase-like protein [Powellomyces hirtus]
MSAGTHTGDTIPSVGNLLVSPNIPEWLRRVVDKGIDISTFLHEEYKEIENLEVSRIREGGRGPGHPYSYSVAQQSQNMRRNRYYDIIPYDRSRVVLSSPSPSDKSDYINASHFQGLPGTRPYVVSQGPMESICGDFWQMIWEQKTSLIVMLTNEEERGRVKCHRYVPRTPGQRVQYDNLGGISVTLIEEETMPNGEVVLRRVSLEHGRETRNLWQLHFTAWPDHRASSPQSVLSVLDLSRQLQTLAEKETDAGPMVVHCSAGCGRTGTFCTIDGVLQLLENQSNVHGQDDLVRQTVDKLREQRVSAVQTVEQYAFCYEAVLYRLLEWQHGVGDTRPAWIQLAPTAGPGSDRQ